MYSLLFVNGLGFDDFSKQGVPYQEQFEGLIGNGKTFSKRSVVWFALHVCGTYGRQEWETFSQQGNLLRNDGKRGENVFLELVEHLIN